VRRSRRISTLTGESSTTRIDSPRPVAVSRYRGSRLGGGGFSGAAMPSASSNASRSENSCAAEGRGLHVTSSSPLRPSGPIRFMAGSSPDSQVGTVNQNVEPRPRSLSTPMSPRWASTIVLLIESPRPTPSYSGLIAPPARRNCSQTISRSSSAMPTPVSSTATRTCVSSAVTWNRTWPFRVNCTAFPRKLSRTCRSFLTSPCTGGRSRAGPISILTS